MRKFLDRVPDGVQQDIAGLELVRKRLQPGWLNLIADGKRPQGEPTRTDMAIGGSLMVAAGLGVSAIAFHARH